MFYIVKVTFKSEHWSKDTECGSLSLSLHSSAVEQVLDILTVSCLWK